LLNKNFREEGPSIQLYEKALTLYENKPGIDWKPDLEKYLKRREK